MQQEKNKKSAILFWILSIVCMGVIFYFSSRTADESSAQSDTVLNWLISIFGDNKFTTFIVRKSAHCLEFTGLCVLFNCAWYFTLNRKAPLIAILCSSLYAVSDEIHQLFVEGRSCEIGDWAIDTFGAVLGTIGFLILFWMIDKIVKKCKNSIDTGQ